MAKYRCAILDDFQNVALKVADWSKVSGDLDIKVFNEHLGGADNVVKALQGFQIVCAMRERTALPARRHREAARPEAPDHHRHAQRLDRHGGGGRRGVTVCGTGSFGSPTSGIAIGLMLELTRHIGYENARLKAGETWQVTIGPELEGMTLGILGLGKLGTRTAAIGKAFGMKVIAWSRTSRPRSARRPASTTSRKEELFKQSDFISIHVVLSQRSRGLVGARGIRADEADRLSHQHLARADRRRGGDAGRAA